MEIEKEVIDLHLLICKDVCDSRGYNQLSYQREQIKERVLKSLDGNGHDLKRVSQILDISDNTMFHYLDTHVMNRGRRPFGWPGYHEQKLREEISIALQSA